MSRIRSLCSRLTLIGLSIGLLGMDVVASANPIGFKRAPVTESDVPRMKFTHYYSLQKQFQQPDFEWTFSKSEFVIKKGTGPIPADLLEKLLPPNTEADEIRGKWKLEKNQGVSIVLTDVKAGQIAGKESVSFGIFRTAPTIIRLGNPQYVFSLR